ncbi:MAG: hypothetical protein ABJC79_13030 [Acidimicrobiia bacterium]
MVIDLALLWVVGIVFAVPVVLWFGRDLTRIPTYIWAVTGLRREHWQWGVLLGWVAGGFPAMVIVLVWSKSVERSTLYRELAEMQRDRRR